MDIITSEIKTTPLTIDTNYTHVKESDILMFDKTLTEKLMWTDSLYGTINFYRNDGIIGASLLAYGEYTQFEINLLSHVINDETVVYDIGANIGYHTLGFASKAKHVYAFEPNNKNYKLLQANTGIHKNVTTYNFGVSDKNIDSFIEDFEPGVLNNYGELHLSNSGQPCKLVKLDDFIKKENLPEPQVIKIDVEGHEYEVLMGLDNTIRNTLPVIFYEHQHGDHLPEIYDYLTSLNYKIFWFGCPNYNPNNFKNNKNNYFENNTGVINAFAVPNTIQIKTNLPQKLSRNETYNDMLDRLKNNVTN